MANKKKEQYKDTVTLSCDFLLDELLFPAIRYCINRHSYVSSYAQDYWNIIRHNQEAFNTERLKFFAGDIKAQISDAMNWWKNVHTTEAYNNTIKYDAYFLLTKFLYEHQNIKFEEYDFDINCFTGSVVATKRETPLTDSEKAWNDIPNCDLSPWSHLASRITDGFMVIVKGNDNTQKVEVCESYDYVRYEGEAEHHWVKYYNVVDSWRQIVPEEIIIKKLDSKNE